MWPQYCSHVLPALWKRHIYDISKALLLCTVAIFYCFARHMIEIYMYSAPRIIWSARDRIKKKQFLLSELQGSRMNQWQYSRISVTRSALDFIFTSSYPWIWFNRGFSSVLREMGLTSSKRVFDITALVLMGFYRIRVEPGQRFKLHQNSNNPYLILYFI